MSDEYNRRDFIRKTALGTVAAGLALARAGSAKPVPPSDKVLVGAIGTGKQGTYDFEDFLRQGDVEVVAVCDVYQPHLQNAMKAAGEKAQSYKDFRQVLDRKDIDVIVIGTPNHWHALPMVEACKAGKDVYVEKPLSHTLDEGKLMVEAARKYNRVVQVGTQQRSGIHFQKAVQLIQDGFIGKVSFVRTWNYANEYPKGIGDSPNSHSPSDLDWEMWLGPAPRVPFNWNRFGPNPPGKPFRWSTFRYFWDYGGGYMTDWGTHLMDIVQWAMKVDGPSVITGQGGKYYIQDDAQTPDTLQVTYEYKNPDFVCVYENRWDNANSMYGKSYGMEFHGTDGTLFIDRSGFEVIPEHIDIDAGTPVEKTGGEQTMATKMSSVNDSHFDHVRNFLDCVKSRRRPVSDIEIGHRSTSACLLGNVAYRSRERIVWDVAGQRLISGGPAAEKLLRYDYRAPWKLKV